MASYVGMNPTAVSLTMEQFAAELGLTVRVLRSWFKIGLMPPPPRRGRSTRYEAQHLRMARAIQTLRARNMRLEDIRAQLGRMTTDELDAMIAHGPVAGAVHDAAAVDGPAPNAPGEPTYAFVRWQHIELMPGLELRVRDDVPVGLRRLAQDIVTHYGAARSRI